VLDVLYNLTIELTTRADNLMIELTFQDFYLNIVPSSSTFLHIVTLNPCDMTHSYAWHDLCVCATWRILPRHQSSSWVIITFEPMIMTLLNIWLCVTCHDSIHVCDVSQFQIAPALSLHTQSDILKRRTTWQDLMLAHMLTCKHRYSMRLLCAWDALNTSPHSMQLLCHSIIQYAITYANITWFDAAIRFCEHMTYQYITIFDAATMSPFNMPTFNMPISRDSMQLFDSVNIWHITWWHITIFDAPTIYLYFTFLYHHILFQRPISRHSIRYTYGVATVSSVDSIIGLCCRISSLL